MIKIPLGKDLYGKDTSYYSLEYKKPLGLFNENSDAVQVRLCDTPRNVSVSDFKPEGKLIRFRLPAYGPYMDVNTGEDFFDPYRGIKIEMVEKTGEGADSKAKIRVTFSGVDITSKNQPRYDNLIKMNGSGSGPNPRTVTLTNNTDAPLSIGQIAVKGRDPSAYKIIEDSVSNTTIQVSGKATLKVHFVPTSSSTKLAYLSIPTNNELRPEATISLYGYDSSSPSYDSNGDPVKLTAPPFSTNVSKTNSFSISWITKDFTPVRYQLQYRPHTTTAWSNLKVDGSYWTTKTKRTFTGKPGFTYYFRARAKDSAGNTSDWSWEGASFTIIPFDDTSLTYSPGWKSINPKYAYKNTTHYTTKEGAYATFTYKQDVNYDYLTPTLIAPVGPYKGKMKIYVRNKINGVWTNWYDTWERIDLYSPTYKSRQSFRMDVNDEWYLDEEIGDFVPSYYDKTDTHQIKLVRSEYKNKNSSGYRVDIDGIAIRRGVAN